MREPFREGPGEASRRRGQVSRAGVVVGGGRGRDLTCSHLLQMLRQRRRT